MIMNKKYELRKLPNGTYAIWHTEYPYTPPDGDALVWGFKTPQEAIMTFRRIRPMETLYMNMEA